MKTNHTLNLSSELALTPFQLLDECRDEGMKKVVRDIKTYANANGVMLTGETGVGKEIAARALTEIGDRCSKPAIIVDCTQLKGPTFRSEAFGHEKNSFTGANEQKIGLFELADGGTLFLDEIGELDLEEQPKLLRALAEKTFTRHGGTRMIKSDFRLICATNRDLAGMVRAGKFREDLYYRVTSFPIHIPPLRERKADVSRLANHLLDDYSDHKKTFTKQAQDVIISHDWPGNVRELEKAVERSVVHSNGRNFVDVVDLRINYDQLIKFNVGTKDLDEIDLMNLLIARIGKTPAEELIAAGGLRAVFEKLLIQVALERNHGNKLKAAEHIGIGRQTLYNKLDKYAIEY